MVDNEGIGTEGSEGDEAEGEGTDKSEAEGDESEVEDETEAVSSFPPRSLPKSLPPPMSLAELLGCREGPEPGELDEEPPGFAVA